MIPPYKNNLEMINTFYDSSTFSKKMTKAHSERLRQRNQEQSTCHLTQALCAYSMLLLRGPLLSQKNTVRTNMSIGSQCIEIQN